MKTTLLFVYGTLKRGLKNHFRMNNARFVGTACTAPRFRLLHLGGFPGLIRDAQNGYSVTGELWSVPDDTLQALDEFEGKHVFERQSVELSDGASADAYIFLRAQGGERDCGSTWP